MSGESFFRPDPLARIFRRECSDCGFGSLTWCTVERLAQLVRDDARQRVHEMVEFFGTETLDCWFCSRCNAFGGMA